MRNQCTVDGCEKPRFGRGLCNMHYQRLRKTGTLELARHRSRCVVTGCDDLVKGGGLCQTHYFRQQRHGSTDDPRPSAQTRFWSKVDRSGSCWLWTARRNRDGYGIFWFDGRSWFAHRWSYEQAAGPVGDLSLDHLCRVRACVNPAHLEAVPIVDNIRRGYGVAGTNARKTHCKRGHPFDDANTYVMRGGGRMCRACQREQRHQRYLSSRQGPTAT
jgi:hypothetical protein